jgi:hypothetical protein
VGSTPREGQEIKRNLLAGLEAPIHGSRGALHTTLDNRLTALRSIGIGIGIGIGIDRDTPIIPVTHPDVEDPAIGHFRQPQ